MPAISPDNSFTDLSPGGRIRILVPLLKPGESRVVWTVSKDQIGNTIALSADNLIGYEVSYYSIEARSHGRVRLKFSSAQVTKNGITVQEDKPPQLPLALPVGAQHIRLIYYIRNSQSDHNMAIASSKSLEELEVFTKRFKLDPDVCKPDGEVSCSWVPAEIAVRPER